MTVTINSRAGVPPPTSWSIDTPTGQTDTTVQRPDTTAWSDRTAGDPVPVELVFDDFYHAHFRNLTVQLCAYTGDLGQAQDLTQEAFCRAFARWDQIVRYDDPLAWVRRVAWNLANSRWRRLRTAHAYLRRQRETHVAGPNPNRVALEAALALLPANQRRAVVLHHLADLPVAEIARQAGVPEGTVKSWLHRGRAALAALLRDEADGVGGNTRTGGTTDSTGADQTAGGNRTGDTGEARHG